MKGAAVPALACMIALVAVAQAGAARGLIPHAPAPAGLHRIGLWDKPNEACISKCQSFVKKGCFTRLSKARPGADPSAIHSECEDKYSVCLYDCMCETCDENQIIIKQ